jgi:hypothetical protein
LGINSLHKEDVRMISKRKPKKVVAFVAMAVLFLVSLACGSSASPTLTATSAPPIDTEPQAQPTQTSASVTQQNINGGDSVIIFASEEQMAVIESLPEDVVCLTSAKNPINTLDGLQDDEFASWVTSFEIPQKLMAAFGRPDTPVGLHIIGTGNEEAFFDTNPKLRLFITHEPYVEDLIKHGGVRIEFQLRK